MYLRVYIRTEMPLNRAQNLNLFSVFSIFYFLASIQGPNIWDKVKGYVRVVCNENIFNLEGSVGLRSFVFFEMNC